MSAMSSVVPRFETLRVGTASLDIEGQHFEQDIRVVRSSDQSYRVLFGELSGPLIDLEAALQAARPPAGIVEGARCSLRWRSEGELELVEPG
jgi:hypothetical protein